jgi:hypothetical protein
MRDIVKNRAEWTRVETATRAKVITIKKPAPFASGLLSKTVSYGNPGQVFFSSFWKLSQRFTEKFLGAPK